LGRLETQFCNMSDAFEFLKKRQIDIIFIDTDLAGGQSGAGKYFATGTTVYFVGGALTTALNNLQII
jgi:hypothetical protein